jgi:hypothetical protein
MEGKRLRKILELTRRVENARKGELSAARKEQLEASALVEQRKSEERAQLKALEDSGELAVYCLADQAGLLSLAAAQVHKARAQKVASDAELARREVTSVEAARDVRKFEILCERDGEQSRLAEKHAEQQALDETRRSPRRGMS